MNYQEAHEFRFVGFLRSCRSLVAQDCYSSSITAQQVENLLKQCKRQLHEVHA